MTVRSRYSGSDTYSRLLTTGASIAVIIAVGFFAGPYLRDTVVSVFYSSDVAGRYAALPRATLIERLVRAEDDVVRTRYQAVLYESVFAEVTALREELKLRVPESYIAARVVAAPPRTHYDTLVLSVGSDDGVRVGDIATAHGVALGVVTDVSLHSAIAQLYSSPGAEHDTFVGEPRAIVIARGLGGGALEATVPDSIAVSPGDTVVDATSGFPYAVVSSVVKREIDTSALVKMSIVESPSTIVVVSLVHPDVHPDAL